MKQIYVLGIYLFSFAVRLYSLFNEKTRKMLSGHSDTWSILSRYSNESFIWIHAASLGEFEQGRPIIDRLKKDFPDQRILLTFFSPSGYEVRKKYKNADLVLYLPFDTPSNAKKFVQGLNFKMAIFIKYEFWFNYLIELQKQNISTYYISSTFRKNQIYFKSYSNWMREVFGGVKKFFVQNVESQEILNAFGINDVMVSGDTRLDSVVENANQSWESEIIENSLDGRKVVVFGSSWPADHEQIINFINLYKEKYQYIIAPHNIGESEINKLQDEINLKVDLITSSESFKDVLILNTIGMLKFIYRYADVVYIGGGFENGIHNTLEPLAYLKPVLFGPQNHESFPEAVSILELNLGKCITKESFSRDITYFLDNPQLCSEIKSRIQSYIDRNKGGSEKIISVLAQELI